MQLRKLFAGLVTLTGVAPAIDLPDTKDLQQVESLREVPYGWHAIGAPDATLRIQFRIAMHSVGYISASYVSACYFYKSKYLALIQPS
jgi:hypothetical protein